MHLASRSTRTLQTQRVSRLTKYLLLQTNHHSPKYASSRIVFPGSTFKLQRFQNEQCLQFYSNSSKLNPLLASSKQNRSQSNYRPKSETHNKYASNKKSESVTHKEDVDVVHSYIKAIKYYGRMKSKYGAARAIHTLNSMKRDGIRVNTIVYNSVIDAIGKSSQRNENAGQKAEELLEEMKNLYGTGLNKNVQPDITTYNTVLSTMSNNIINDIATENKYNNNNNNSTSQKAIIILNEMIHSSEIKTNNNKPCYPNKDTYDIVMSIIVKCGSENSGKEAEKILNKMIDLYYEKNKSHSSQKKRKHVKPDIQFYNYVMKAYANSKGCRKSVEKTTQFLVQTYRLFTSMNDRTLKPSCTSYSYLIDAIANSGDTINAGRRAEELLDETQRIYQASDKEDLNFKPNTAIYNSVIRAYANSIHDHNNDNGRKAEKLLQKMLFLYTKLKDEDIKPNLETYHSVMNAMAISGSSTKEENAGKRAEEILNRMLTLSNEDIDRSLKPNVTTYNCVINAYVYQNNTFDAAIKADELLSRMKYQYEYENNNLVRPNVTTYKYVIKAFSKCDNDDDSVVEKIDSLLQLSMNDYLDDGNIQAKPHVEMFSMSIDAWVSRRRRIKQQSSSFSSNHYYYLDQILNRFNSMYCLGLQPDRILYHKIINAIPFTNIKARKEAKKIWMQIVKSGGETYNGSMKMFIKQNGVITLASELTTTKKSLPKFTHSSLKRFRYRQ